ncbi:ion transporter [Planomonospora sp. ID67723]|uniref:ion transporter n=1 Tax=Planomonospora sp. ID67723 TaxID=2738134 RepID=UPI0027DB0D52|nr:ion transporter [Planomonospora sp. ID67723]
MRSILESRFFQRALITVIVLNTATIGAETSAVLTDHIGGILHTVDRVTLAVFVVELGARAYAYRGAFLKDPWNHFDAVIVAGALIPASGPVSVLRALRILRALRLVSAVPSMRKVVTALLAAIPGMASIIGLLVLVMYVSAVLATELFGQAAPAYFAELPVSLFTLFQMMTGDAWSDITRTVMAEHPWAWVFFIGYILVSTFVVLNLFIAVVVNAMDEQSTSSEEERTDEQLATVLAELARLHAKIDAIQAAPAVPVVPDGRLPTGTA